MGALSFKRRGRTNPLHESKQRADRMALFKQMIRLSFTVTCGQVVNAHCMKNSVSDILRTDHVLRRIFGALVAGAVHLPAADAAAGEEHGHARRPMVAAGATFA